jgi:nucleotide-binding universal stress UspA family protein
MVGADGSSTSPVAEQRAARLANQLGAELTFIHVSEDEETAKAAGTEVLEAAAERARLLGVEARTEHRHGEVAPSIMTAAADLRADLLVIGDRGMGSATRFSLGAIPTQVAHHSPIDILVVRSSDPRVELQTYQKILLATDGSLTAHQATRHGHALAQALGAEAALVYVGDELIGDIVLRDTAARLGDDDLHASWPGAIQRLRSRGSPKITTWSWWATRG